MISTFALSLLPDLLHWLPIGLGVAGGGVGLLGFVPKLRTALPWILGGLLVVAILGLLWFRGEYAGARAELANFRAASAATAVKEKTNATQSRARTDDAVRKLAPADVLDGLR